MIEFIYDADGGKSYSIWADTEEEKARLLNVLKRGSNTLSPPDMEIIKLIGEMEK